MHVENCGFVLLRADEVAAPVGPDDLSRNERVLDEGDRGRHDGIGAADFRQRQGIGEGFDIRLIFPRRGEDHAERHCIHTDPGA